MERLDNLSAMLAQLVQDSRKKKNENENKSALIFKNFSSLNLPSYNGKPNPVKFEDWISRIYQLFCCILLTDQGGFWRNVNKKKKNEPYLARPNSESL